MAAPPVKHIHDINGIWLLNKTFSDSVEPVLRLQNVTWILRRAIQLADISLHTTQVVNDAGIVSITIKNVASFGLSGTTEMRYLDWEPREHKDYIWGYVRAQSRYVSTTRLEEQDSFLTSGWMDETARGECIQDNADAIDGSWTSTSIWGFEMVCEDRKFVRHVLVQRGDDVATAKLVYDYVGPVYR